MSREQFDDVTKMELPEYREDSFAIPDIEPEGSFAENKDDIFLRNMIIAAKEARPPVQKEDRPKKIDAEEFFARNDLMQSEKRSRDGILSKLISILTEHSKELKIIYLLAMVAIVTIMMVMLILAFQIKGRSKTPVLDIILPPATGAAVTEIVITTQYEELVTGETEILEDRVTEVIPEDVAVTVTEESVLR